MHNLTQAYEQTRAQLTHAAASAERDHAAIGLLAVSKKHSAAKMRQVFALGQRAFGENYVQEAMEKQPQLSDLAIQWHFIGPIQSNKTRALAEHFDWIQSVDRIKIAERLSQQRPDTRPPLNICLQVNIDDEPTKAGFNASELKLAAHAIAALPKLQLRGLMAIPAPQSEYDAQCATFAKVAALFNSLKNEHPSMDTLSMGMSADMAAAVAAGSTMVRVGTGIFGARV